MKQRTMLLITASIVALIAVVLFLFWSRLQLTPPQTETIYDVKTAFPNLSFNLPVGIYASGDGTNRLFVLEKPGVIRVFENRENVTSASVFLDIQDRVNSEGYEEGLLGLAFHPDYATNRYFYLDYTANNPRRTIISRFSVSQTNLNQADKNSELILLEIPQPYSNHNGGQIAFGPDSHLYIAMGDGGSAGDPQGNGQNLTTLLGKILRINVDASSDSLNYSIPSDNPFVGNTRGYREEIYAYGLRNPWRFSFDPETDWLWAADVGQDRVEEIDIIQKGKNYGWNIMEGNLCYNPAENCNQTGLEMPIWTYGHDQGNSVTGGFVYRGSELTGLKGSYVYADFGSGRIWSLNYDGTSPAANRQLSDTNLNITSFGMDERNELYFCAYDGKIYKLTEATTNP